MPRCYMVKKSPNQRHEGPPPCSPTEASVAPPCYSPDEQHSSNTEERGAEYAEMGVPLLERSAADTEAAHDLLSLAQSLPPLPPAAVVTVLQPEPPPPAPPVVPLYTYTLQPTNIFILTDEMVPEQSVYQTIQTLTNPLVQTVEYIDQQPSFVTIPFQNIEESVPEYAEEIVQEYNLEPQEYNPEPQEYNPEPQYYEQEIITHETPVINAEETNVIQVPETHDVVQVRTSVIQEVPHHGSEKRVTNDPESRVIELRLEPESEPEEDKKVSPKNRTQSTPYPRSMYKKGKLAKYDCSECGKRYATSSNLSRHKQTHRSLDSQAAKRCDHCGKVYVSMPALAMHVLTHRMGHVCSVCGKQFSRPWLLRGHLRSHTGEKPYRCGDCGKAFADRSNLRAHLQTHSVDKKFSCERCHKTFALKSYLNKHQESSCLLDDEDDSFDSSCGSL